jgi:hypothetical protein
MNPVDNPGSYDFLVLSGRRSPGKCTLSFPTRSEGWDKQQPKGSQGGETVHNASPLIEFEVELYLWKESWGTGGVDHFAEWDLFWPIFQLPIASNASKALDIYHPQLDGLGITSVVVSSWTQPQPDGTGGATVKIKFLQYAPPKKKTGGKPSGSGSKGGAGSNPNSPANQKPDPNAELKKQLAQLTEEFKAA